MTEAPRPSPNLLDPTWHRFISPHYDDIALSCGGTVARLAGSGATPEIAVVFGDRPDSEAPLSPFAAAMHAGWGLTADQVIDARRREEAAAASRLGATSVTLPFLDAIYRDGRYASDDQLFGPPLPEEGGLAATVTAALGDAAADPAARYYAPLAVGDHVDHRHGFAVGLALASRGHEVWFYEDLPYAIRAGALDRRLQHLAATTPVKLAATVDVGDTWETKLRAILAYSSQLATVFGYVGAAGTLSDIDRTMRRYAEQRGDARPVECFWRLVERSPSRR